MIAFFRCPMCDWQQVGQTGDRVDKLACAVLQHVLDCPARPMSHPLTRDRLVRLLELLHLRNR